VLSAYAQFLTSIRRLSDANIIFKKLAPLYDQYLPKHGPKYLTFAGHYLFNLTALGYFQPSAENVLKILNDLVVTVDIPPDAVKGELYFQNLYKTARVPRTDAEHPIVKQLKTIAATFPDYLKQPHLFGGVKDCLQGTKHILLATDPDFFSVPWNALLTASPPSSHPFQYREAAWFPKSYSLSLLPSARSLYQLRDHLPESRARDNFLGIGDPDFTGHSNDNKQIALAPLFASRGLANRAAIEDLDRLPETADELRIVAKALGNVRSTILLGAHATEHELRKQQLSNYRVISFATHALVAGGLVALHSDFDGLCRAFRLARARVSNQRGPRCCEASLVAL
jgi:hypothetical protein